MNWLEGVTPVVTPSPNGVPEVGVEGKLGVVFPSTALYRQISSATSESDGEVTVPVICVASVLAVRVKLIGVPGGVVSLVAFGPISHLRCS